MQADYEWPHLELSLVHVHYSDLAVLRCSGNRLNWYGNPGWLCPCPHLMSLHNFLVFFELAVAVVSNPVIVAIKLWLL